MQSASLIDMEALPPSVRSYVEYALAEAMERHERSQLREKAAEFSDQQKLEIAQREFPDAPIGLSTWYKQVLWCQETGIFGFNGTRPVFLRGSREVRIRLNSLSNHCSANGWAINVFWRAIRKSKLTALDYEEFEAAANQIRHKLRKRYRLTHAFDDQVTIWARCFREMAVIGGKKVYLSEGQLQHIRALRKIIVKADRLDEKMRRALVRQQMQERLAA